MLENGAFGVNNDFNANNACTAHTKFVCGLVN